MSGGTNSSETLDSCLTTKSSNVSVHADDHLDASRPSSLISGYLADRDSTREDTNSGDEALSNNYVNFPSGSISANDLIAANLHPPIDAGTNIANEEIGDTEEGGRAQQVQDLTEGDDATSAPSHLNLVEEKEEAPVANLRRKRTEAESLVGKKRRTR